MYSSLSDSATRISLFRRTRRPGVLRSGRTRPLGPVAPSPRTRNNPTEQSTLRHSPLLALAQSPPPPRPLAPPLPSPLTRSRRSSPGPPRDRAPRSSPGRSRSPLPPGPLVLPAPSRSSRPARAPCESPLLPRSACAPCAAPCGVRVAPSPLLRPCPLRVSPPPLHVSPPPQDRAR